jgi:hypothetical protein
VNEFVEQCRREWKRLGVPSEVADEMAAELAADLNEGVSSEDVLGRDAADARSFAAAWAAERAVVPRRRKAIRIGVLAAATALALVVIAGALLALLASPSRGTRLSIQPAPEWTPTGSSQRVWVGPPARVTIVAAPGPSARTPPLVRLTTQSDSGTDQRTVGFVLLIIGTTGLVITTLFWVASGRRLRSRLVALNG